MWITRAEKREEKDFFDNDADKKERERYCRGKKFLAWELVESFLLAHFYARIAERNVDVVIRWRATYLNTSCIFVEYFSFVENIKSELRG